MKSKLSSRKFWVAVASALFVMLTEGFGINIDPAVYWSVVGIATAYIVGETAVDIARKEKK